MKKLLFISLLMISGLITGAQGTPAPNLDYQQVGGTLPLDTLSKILIGADQLPSYPGGPAALMHFLNTHMAYPEAARDSMVQGKVIVKFVVCEDGSLCNEEVVRSLGSGCDEEVIRVVKSMPRWKPGTLNGKPVKVYYSLPVTFKLEDDTGPDQKEKK